MFDIFEVAPAVAILVISFALALVSKILQRNLLDKKKMDAQKKEMKEKQERLKKLTKDGESKKEEIEKLQLEIAEASIAMMQGTNKLMLVSLPVFAVFFMIMGNIYGGLSFTSLFPLPHFTGFWLLNPFSWIPTFPAVCQVESVCFLPLTMTTGYLKAYFFYYFVSSIAISGLEKLYDNYLNKLGNELITKKLKK
ncbi:MAG: EMC3/TMCO1 family protein [archaeon]